MPDETTAARPAPSAGPPAAEPTSAQRAWLARGLGQPGGKLPLFDEQGRRTAAGIVRACIASGWGEPCFANPLKPDWLVCRLTPAGRARLAADLGITARPDCAGG